MSKLEFKNVSFTYPNGFKAINDLNLVVNSSEKVAIVGQNGAGKSTLMKCLFGIYKMDTGKIKVDGQNVNIENPDDALKKGLAMVHQELQPVPERSIAENMYLGRYPTKGIGPFHIIDHAKMNEEAKKWLAEVLSLIHI